jgi:hypothetical protein
MCRKKLSLPKLRKLALEHNINIFSEAKTAISKRTGMPKKPKLVGCSTLMKRLDEAGLSNLYKTRSVSVDMNMPGDLFMESQMVDMPGMPGMPEMPGMPGMPEMQEQSLIDPECNVYWSNWSNANSKKAKGFRGIMRGDGDCATRAKNNKLVPDEEVDTDALAEEAGFDMLEVRKNEIYCRLIKRGKEGTKHYYRKAGQIPKLSSKEPLLKLNETIRFLKLVSYGNKN